MNQDRLIYIDAVGGVAGDMLLGAILDGHGADVEAYLLKELEKLSLPGWSWQRQQVKRQGFAGAKIDFQPESSGDHRHLSDILALVKAANFPPGAEKRIFTAFDILATAEAKVHGATKEEVHFHEVGAVDTILDICGVCLLLDHLNVTAIHCGDLPMGQGTVRCAHGEMPLPAPAVAAMLQGVPVRPVPVDGETVTPTGIALLKAWDAAFTAMPRMALDSVGVGCGSRDGEVPNICRVFSGHSKLPVQTGLYRVECTIDDMTGEEMGFLWARVEAAGANDMYYTPVYMKKGRPAVKLTVLAEERALKAVQKAIFTDTTTLGMITTPVERAVLKRKITTVTTPYGDVRYKVAAGFGVTKAKAEYEDLKKIAAANDIPLKEARKAADSAFTQTTERENR